MNEITIVMKKQLQVYLHNKESVIFHLGILAVLGFICPFFIRNETALINIVFFFPLLLLKQWALESFSEEKEWRTLETLLSSPIKAKNLYSGKCAYCLFMGYAYFLIIIVMMISVKCLIRIPFHFSITTGICLLILYLQSGFFIAITGTLVSIYSENTPAANSRFFIPFYAIYIYLFLVITLFIQQLELAAYLLSIIFLGTTFLITLWTWLTKINKLNRYTFLLNK